jgi:hypothetical protein
VGGWVGGWLGGHERMASRAAPQASPSQPACAFPTPCTITTHTQLIRSPQPPTVASRWPRNWGAVEEEKKDRSKSARLSPASMPPSSPSVRVATSAHTAEERGREQGRAGRQQGEWLRLGVRDATQQPSAKGCNCSARRPGTPHPTSSPNSQPSQQRQQTSTAKPSAPMDPTLLPASTRGSMWCSSSALTTPRWKAPSEPPPLQAEQGRGSRQVERTKVGELSSCMQHCAVSLGCQALVQPLAGIACTARQPAAPQHQCSAAISVPGLFQKGGLLLERQVCRQYRWAGQAVQVQNMLVNEAAAMAHRTELSMGGWHPTCKTQQQSARAARESLPFAGCPPARQPGAGADLASW